MMAGTITWKIKGLGQRKAKRCTTCKNQRKEKKLIYKIKDRKPSIKSTRQMKSRVDTTQ